MAAMVFFRPTQPESAGARKPEPGDFGPLALAEPEPRFDHLAETAAAEIRTARLQPASFVVPETRAADTALAPSMSVGTVWHAGILDELKHPRVTGELANRIVCAADDTNRWLQARRQGVTATDAARLTSAKSVRSVVLDKVQGGSFTGNAYTEHGRKREPHIIEWMRQRHGIAGCGLLIRSAENERHLATPDGLAQWGDEVVLAEIKTTNKAWNRIPRNYLRQVWWQQYVVGVERTLFVWEVHHNFVVQDAEPHAVWIERDDAEIEKLVQLADHVLEQLDSL